MFSFKNISKEFSGHFWKKKFLALDDVSFTVNEGELVGFLGANGAGKTTSIKILMNFISSEKGSIVYNNQLGRNQVERLSNIGYFPERPFFYPHLTGREFIYYLGSLNNLSRDQINNGLKQWAERLQLEFALDRKIRGYSKGMLQRLGFITSLIHDPKLVILDEPLSGLDPIGRKEFKDVLRYLHTKGVTIFFSSHIISDVEELCEKVILLRGGKMIYDGGIKELIEKDGHINFVIRAQMDTPLSDCFYQQFIILDNEEKLYEYHIDENKKNDILKEIMAKNGNIEFVGTVSPSLEEIIYNIKK